MSRRWEFVLGVLVAALVSAVLTVAWNANRDVPAPTPPPRETPRVWEMPSGNGVCVLYLDTPIGCYQKGEAP